MDLRSELLANSIADKIIDSIKNIRIDADEAVKIQAEEVLSEIKQVIQNNKLSDFEAVENIVCIFEKYSISAGGRHDF